MRQLPACRHSQYGVFTSTQAQVSGLSRAALRHLLSTGRIAAVRRGAFIEVRMLEGLPPRERALATAVASCLRLSGSALSHHSAALIHQLPLVGTRPAIPDLTIASEASRSGRQTRTSNLRVAALPADHVDNRGEWSVTTLARTICDLTRETTPLDGLVAADAALSRRLVTKTQLARVADDCAGWPASRRLRALLHNANGAAESPYETVARHFLQEAGLEPTPQVWAYDERGPIGCGDLWLPHLWVFLEVDGDIKYTATSASTLLLEEKRRQERLEEAGFGVARVSAREARQPNVLLDKVARAAARGRVARAGSTCVGSVGPPPYWAQRGTAIPVMRAYHL